MSELTLTKRLELHGCVPYPCGRDHCTSCEVRTALAALQAEVDGLTEDREVWHRTADDWRDEARRAVGQLGAVETAARAVCDNVDPDPYALSRQMDEDLVCELCGAREEEETQHEEDCLWRLVERLRAALGPAR